MLTIIDFTNELLRRGWVVENMGGVIGVALGNSRFTLLTNEDRIIGVAGYFIGDYDIRECNTLHHALSVLLAYA